VLADYAYDPVGRLATTTRANGAVTSMTYDAAGRVDTLTTDVSGSPVLAFDYAVNRVGQRTQVVETVDSATRTLIPIRDRNCDFDLPADAVYCDTIS